MRWDPRSGLGAHARGIPCAAFSSKFMLCAQHTAHGVCLTPRTPRLSRPPVLTLGLNGRVSTESLVPGQSENPQGRWGCELGH